MWVADAVESCDECLVELDAGAGEMCRQPVWGLLPMGIAVNAWAVKWHLVKSGCVTFRAASKMELFKSVCSIYQQVLPARLHYRTGDI